MGSTSDSPGPRAGSAPPSGAQHEIRWEEQVATVVEVGGGIRSYTWAGRDVLDPYPIEAICDGAHGTPLIPWPNRLADGRYEFDGVEFQVDLTEPARYNAIHGFLRWRPWTLVERSNSSVTMGARIHPMPGYPFDVEVSVRYGLGADGLTVSTTATNRGTTACPYGAGQHPYLSPGMVDGAPGRIDDCDLRIDALTRVLTDDERQLPVGTEHVEGTRYDFRTPRRIADLAIDHAFTDLVRDPAGRAWATLTGADGMTARTWVDEHHPLIQVYTGDTLTATRRRRGLGTEPMTCPPNAFRTGTSVIRLEPGSSICTTWGADLIRP